MSRALRTGVNGAAVVIGLTVALPLLTIAERIKAGAGRAVARFAIRVVARVCGIEIVVVGAGRVASVEGRPHVLVPNHSSPVDIAALLSARPDARFVAAAELFRLPLLGAAMRAMGCVPVDRKRPTRTPNLEGRVDRGGTVVFAEGGIPAPGEERRFETGAFVLAISAGAPVVPVTIRGSAAVLPRGSRVWARPGTITVELHDPIDTTDLTLGDRKALRDRTERVVRGAGP